MARTDRRGGPHTRARIAEAASGLFVERGFDAVTVADVARAAGVSAVTVYNHFPRKEDLFLDRSADAVDVLRAAVRDRRPGVDVVSSLRATTLALVDAGRPLSGVDPRSVPFLRTVAGSPSLLARAREIAADLQQVLAAELERDEAFDGDAELFAAFALAGYATVLVGTARRLVAGEPVEAVVGDHRARFERLFAALRASVGRSVEAQP